MHTQITESVIFLSTPGLPCLWDWCDWLQGPSSSCVWAAVAPPPTPPLWLHRLAKPPLQPQDRKVSEKGVTHSCDLFTCVVLPDSVPVCVCVCTGASVRSIFHFTECHCAVLRLWLATHPPPWLPPQHMWLEEHPVQLSKNTPRVLLISSELSFRAALVLYEQLVTASLVFVSHWIRLLRKTIARKVSFWGTRLQLVWSRARLCFFVNCFYTPTAHNYTLAHFSLFTQKG